MFIVIARTAILYLVVILVFKIMGKRQIGELQPYEFAIIIMISALAAIPMEDIGIPLIFSIIPIILLLFFSIFISYLSMKSLKFRKFICGSPSIIIINGKINQKELYKLRLNINDLLEQLRIKGYHEIQDIEYALIETNGEISVLPKSQKRPVTPEDLNLDTKYEGLQHSLIIDGVALKENLKEVDLNEEWLRKELLKYNINKFSDVLYAAIDTAGNLIFQKKGGV